jgi:NADPH:quinone reductase-like Zn-dependent oxidoreductase
MFSVFVERPNFDDPISALKVGEFPDPLEVPDGWVKMKLTAASLNWHEIWNLRGMGGANARPERFPLILGSEGVGTLEDGTPVVLYPVIGDPNWRGHDTLDPNRSVFSERYQGTFADYVATPRRNAVPLPKELSPITAAVLGAAWLTAYSMIFTKADLSPGQTMLVQGASGGVSTALIQLGHAAGMQVWATGRTPEKRALAERLGAHRTFATGEPLPRPVDAVLDTTGQATWQHSLRSVKTGGTIVACGAASGDQPPADLARVFIEQITVRGVFAGTLEEFGNLLTFITHKRIEPYISEVLPMAEAKKGFRAIWEGSNLGKIVFKR